MRNWSNFSVSLLTVVGIPPTTSERSRAPRSFRSLQKGARDGAALCWAVHPALNSVAVSGNGVGNVPFSYRGLYGKKKTHMRGCRGRRGGVRARKRVSLSRAVLSPTPSYPVSEVDFETTTRPERVSRVHVNRVSGGRPGFYFGSRQGSYYLGQRETAPSDVLRRLAEWSPPLTRGGGGRRDRGGPGARALRNRSRRFCTRTGRYTYPVAPAASDLRALIEESEDG
jgi:hypothetical protein